MLITTDKQSPSFILGLLESVHIQLHACMFSMPVSNLSPNLFLPLFLGGVVGLLTKLTCLAQQLA